MNTTLVIFFLTVQSSYSEDSEEPATSDAFDTIQFYRSADKGSWRIKTYAKDQDVHAWSIGDVEDIVALARSNTEKHYGDVLREMYIFESATDVDGLRKEIAVRGLSMHLEISEAGFLFWAPAGTHYRTKSKPR